MFHHSAYGVPLPELDMVVVDDSHPIRRILRSILVAFGVRRVRTFPTVEAAMAGMLESHPNFLITDWRMQPVSGYELIRMIRSDIKSPLCRLPVIMLSGYALQRYVEQTMLIGVHQFLVKPISPEILLQRIDWVLNDSRQFVMKDGTCQISGSEKMLHSVRLRKQRLVDMNAYYSGEGGMPEIDRSVSQPRDSVQPGDSDAISDIWEI
jgi:two-component system chemotaxis response regulator CheY